MQPLLLAGCVTLAPMFVNALLNGLSFRRLAGRPANADAASLSILVPARNEAARIGPLLDSFLALDDRMTLELVVYDDDSTDGMGALVRDYADRDPRIRLIGGKGPPPGWTGRTNGLHRLAEAAVGDWLLFTDADVVLLPGGLERAIAALKADNLDVLTLYPRQILGTFAERAFVPLMVYCFYLLAPQWLALTGARVSVKPLNGQFNLWRRETYAAVGGYAAIKGAWLDDMGMGRHLAATDRRVCYRPGVGIACCRMYAGFRETWNGFAKHAYDAIGLPGGQFLLLQAWLFLAHVAPWLLLPFLLAGHPEAVDLALAGGYVGMTAATRVLNCVQAGGGWTSAVLHPITMAGAIACNLYSYRQYLRPSDTWKGRTRVKWAPEPPAPPG